MPTAPRVLYALSCRILARHEDFSKGSLAAKKRKRRKKSGAVFAPFRPKTGAGIRGELRFHVSTSSSAPAESLARGWAFAGSRAMLAPPYHYPIKAVSFAMDYGTVACTMRHPTRNRTPVNCG